MTVRQTYYTLVASLPPLPHFERAERLPISGYRLEQRLKMLDAEDAAQLRRAQALIGWRPEGLVGRGDEEIVLQYRAIKERPLHPALAEYVSFRMDQLTIMAGLRRRRAKMSPAPGDHGWGAGRWTRWIVDHWDDPDFRFGSVVPWIQEVRSYLEAGEAVSVERLLMDVAWRQLNRIADSNIFGFEAVMAYAFKWDILNNWLAQDAETGKKQFQKLVEEVMHG